MDRNLSQIDGWNKFCSVGSREDLTVACKNIVLLASLSVVVEQHKTLK